MRSHPGELAVAVVVIWNAWSLRATTDAVSYLDDASLHQQMVRFAAGSVRSGSLPALRWFPYLNLGSPHFLHYQGLGATLVGSSGVALGPDAAFRWSLYLMVVLWPVVIYRSGRVFGLPGLAASFAAALSPFLMSAPAVGYEQQAYVWIGYGLWAQLCASWVLPFAWAWTWRAMEDRRLVFRAVLLISLTAALHFETGYLAFVAVLVFPLLRWSLRRARLVNAAVVLVGSLVGTAWVTGPLLLQSNWSALNTTLGSTGLVRGYGARQDVWWLVTGATFDRGRVPVVTLALGVGVVFALVSWRRVPVARALLLLFLCSLLLSFGPTTWGPFVMVVPGHADLYFRRFLMGVQLAGLYLAGLGVYLAGSRIGARLQYLVAPDGGCSMVRRFAYGTGPFVGLGLLVVMLAPATLQLSRYDVRNAAQIGDQRRAEHRYGPQLDPLLAYVKRRGDGRVYAGSPTNWGERFTIGLVPVFKYAESRDVDVVGYTLRTASLMSQPEVSFDPAVQGEYQLFGVRYVLLPPTVSPEPWMTPVMGHGPYRLFVVAPVHYLGTVSLVGTTRLGRSDVGTATRGLLRSQAVAEHRYAAVAWEGSAAPTLHVPPPDAPLGALTDSHVDLLAGWARTRVQSGEGTVVELAASFDPGWVSTVDGRPVPTVQLAPAVVGVVVPPGTHAVAFTYHGFRGLVPLAVTSAVGLVVVWMWSRRHAGLPRVTVDRSDDATTA